MADNGGLPRGSTLLSPLEYMKKAWSSFNLPTQFAPTLDLGELDRRITDLKAVEQWLSLNQSLLRNTIQGLEIQRGTIATVAAFGQAFNRTGDAMAGVTQRARDPASSNRPARAGGLFAMPSRTPEAPPAESPAPSPAPDADSTASDDASRTPRSPTLDAAASFFSELTRLATLGGFGAFGGTGSAARAASDEAAGPETGNAPASADTAPRASADAPPGSASTAGSASVAADPQAAPEPAAYEADAPSAGESPDSDARGAESGTPASRLSAVGQVAETLANNASNAWWNLLEGQFNQILSAATSPSFPSVFGLPGGTPSTNDATGAGAPAAKKGRSTRGARSATSAPPAGSAPRGATSRSSGSASARSKAGASGGKASAKTTSSPAAKRSTRTRGADARAETSETPRRGARPPSAGKRAPRRAG